MSGASGAEQRAPEQRAREFFDAYGRGDFDAVRGALDHDLVSYVTNAEGGADVVERPRRHTWSGCPTCTPPAGASRSRQVLGVDDERVLAMVEIRAERDGRALHNHAGFLLGFSDAGIRPSGWSTRCPEYSAEFWS